MTTEEKFEKVDGVDVLKEDKIGDTNENNQQLRTLPDGRTTSAPELKTFGDDKRPDFAEDFESPFDVSAALEGEPKPNAVSVDFPDPDTDYFYVNNEFISSLGACISVLNSTSKDLILRSVHVHLSKKKCYCMATSMQCNIYKEFTLESFEVLKDEGVSIDLDAFKVWELFKLIKSRKRILIYDKHITLEYAAGVSKVHMDRNVVGIPNHFSEIIPEAMEEWFNSKMDVAYNGFYFISKFICSGGTLQNVVVKESDLFANDKGLVLSYKFPEAGDKAFSILPGDIQKIIMYLSVFKTSGIDVKYYVNPGDSGMMYISLSGDEFTNYISFPITTDGFITVNALKTYDTVNEIEMSFNINTVLFKRALKILSLVLEGKTTLDISVTDSLKFLIISAETQGRRVSSERVPIEMLKTVDGFNPKDFVTFIDIKKFTDTLKCIDPENFNLTVYKNISGFTSCMNDLDRKSILHISASDKSSVLKSRKVIAAEKAKKEAAAEAQTAPA